MLTRHGQMTLMGDTMEVLFAIEQLILTEQYDEARMYANQARVCLTQMAVGWVEADAAYSVLAKSLQIQQEVLKNDDTE